jgi:hypothetical protein
LERILENLDKQHQAVRRNMIYLLERRGEALVKKAKEELAELEKRERGQHERDPERDKEMQKELRSMIERLKVPASKDAKEGEYEVKVGDDTFQYMDSRPVIREDQDVEMDGTGITVLKPRTSRTIREDLAHELRDLVMRGVSEMEAYDAHAEETTRKYKQALERRKERNRSTAAPSGILKNGILKNKYTEITADTEGIRRTATGMPLSGSTPGQVVRTFENIGAVARRGSK